MCPYMTYLPLIQVEISIVFSGGSLDLRTKTSWFPLKFLEVKISAG